MKTSRNAVQIREDDADVVFKMRCDCSSIKRAIVRKCSPQLRVAILISAVTLKLKTLLILMLGKEVVPLLVRRLWVEMVLKALAAPRDGVQVPRPIVPSQIG